MHVRFIHAFIVPGNQAPFGILRLRPPISVRRRMHMHDDLMHVLRPMDPSHLQNWVKAEPD